MYHRGVLCMNSGFCHDIHEKSVLLGYDKASSNNFLLMFWANLSVPSSGEIGRIFKGDRSHLQGSSTLNMGPIGCPETSVRNYHYLLHNNTEECSSLPQISFIYVSQLILQLMLECAFHLTMWQTLFFQIDIKDENITVRMKNRATLILPMYSNQIGFMWISTVMMGTNMFWHESCLHLTQK